MLMAAMNAAQIGANVAPKTPTKPKESTMRIEQAGERIAFVDSIYAMRECVEGREAMKQIEAKKEDLTRGLQDDQRKFEKEVKEFEAKQATLSEETRKKEEKRLIKRQGDLQARMQECEEELKALAQRLMERLAKCIEEAAETIAKQANLDAIVDINTGRVIYSAEKVTYTNQLMSHLDKAPSKTNTAVASTDKTTKKTV